MSELEMSVSEQKNQVLRDRRRRGRAAKVSPNLVPLLRGEAVPYRMLRDEADPPYGLEHTTPAFGIAVSVVVGILLWGVLGLLAWAVLR